MKRTFERFALISEENLNKVALPGIESLKKEYRDKWKEEYNPYWGSSLGEFTQEIAERIGDTRVLSELEEKAHDSKALWDLFKNIIREFNFNERNFKKALQEIKDDRESEKLRDEYSDYDESW